MRELLEGRSALLISHRVRDHPVMRTPSLGRRGEGWVVLQLVLWAALAACGLAGVPWPGPAATPLLAAGCAVAALGVALAGAGAFALGRSLTPFPRPHGRATLRGRGALRLVRHPIYGGGLLIALGWSLAVAPLGLSATAVLAAFFAGKAHREEAWLAERYPDYAAYRERTRRRFLPWVW